MTMLAVTNAKTDCDILMGTRPYPKYIVVSDMLSDGAKCDPPCCKTDNCYTKGKKYVLQQLLQYHTSLSTSLVLRSIRQPRPGIVLRCYRLYQYLRNSD